MLTQPTQTAAQVGRFKYQDTNNDGSITADDRTYLGNPNPDFTYGLNLGFKYKQFDFSALFYGSQGNDIYNTTSGYLDSMQYYAGAKSLKKCVDFKKHKYHRSQNRICNVVQYKGGVQFRFC